MTKELSAKRKVDKCRDTHPLTRCGVGGARGQCGAAARRARAAIGRPRGLRPAPSSSRALIELGLSFDFEWGERAVLRAGKNYRRDPIPSVIGIIRYTRGSSNYVGVSLRALSEARVARGAAPAAVGRWAHGRGAQIAGQPRWSTGT